MKNLNHIILVLSLLFGIQAKHCATHPIHAIAIEKNDTSRAEANNVFAIELYQEIKNTDKNVFFSPFSISTALAMTYAGARDNTEKEMREVMHFQTDQAAFHSQYKSYLKKILALNAEKGIQLNIANSLWAQKDYIFLNSFFTLVEDNYDAPVHLVEFTMSKEREKTRQKINKWIEEKTNNKIENLIQPSDIDELTRLILTNAIYFYGSWEKEFEEEATVKEDFHVSIEESVEADFMKQKGEYNYYENDQIQYLEIPYTSENISMGIVLPQKIDGLKAVEDALTYSQLQDWINNTNKQKITLSLPKFTISYRLNLNKTLINMGMKEAFTNAADFSGMTGKKDLLISEVIHQAFVEINEKGTEAAAATAVVMRMKSAFPEEEKVFTADHPFLFFIKDHKSNSILFIGRIANPAE